MYTCIDEACAFHGNMKSHLGGSIYIGHGGLHQTLLKKILKTNIHWGVSSWCEWICALQFMDNEFFACSGICNNEQYSIPRQPTCNKDGGK